MRYWIMLLRLAIVLVPSYVAACHHYVALAAADTYVHPNQIWKTRATGQAEPAGRYGPSR